MQSLWQTLVSLAALLIEPLQYEFMLRAFASALIVGTLCGATGTYLVVRRLSLLGLVVSNSVVPGIAFAFLLYVNIFVGGFLSGIAAALSLGWLTERTRLRPDAAMGVILSAFFGLGILLITRIQSERKVNLSDFLFGNILGITLPDLITSAGIAVLVLAVIWALWKEFWLLSFDGSWAEAAGLPTRALHYTMMGLTALAVVAAMQAVGVALTIALLVIPAATAYLLTNRLTTMMGLAVGLGTGASLVGLYLSYYLNLASGPTITLVSAAGFALTVLMSPVFARFGLGEPLRRLKGLVVLEGATGEAIPSEPPPPAPVAEPQLRIVRGPDGELVLRPSEQSEARP